MSDNQFGNFSDLIFKKLKVFHFAVTFFHFNCQIILNRQEILDGSRLKIKHFIFNFRSLNLNMDFYIKVSNIFFEKIISKF